MDVCLSDSYRKTQHEHETRSHPSENSCGVCVTRANDTEPRPGPSRVISDTRPGSTSPGVPIRRSGSTHHATASTQFYLQSAPSDQPSDHDSDVDSDSTLVFLPCSTDESIEASSPMPLSPLSPVADRPSKFSARADAPAIHVEYSRFGFRKQVYSRMVNSVG